MVLDVMGDTAVEVLGVGKRGCNGDSTRMRVKMFKLPVCEFFHATAH